MNRTNIVHTIPGGFYGNNPGYNDRDPGEGNVTVASDRIDAALRWLLRRAVVLSILAGRVYAVNPNWPVDSGIRIQYRLRELTKARHARAA
jgi:hypothetical protein